MRSRNSELSADWGTICTLLFKMEIIMSKKNKKIKVRGIEVAFTRAKQEDFICITDIAKFKNPEAPRDIIKTG